MSRQFIWMPYPQKIKSKKDSLICKYKGGQVNTKYEDIHSIMLYGDSCSIPDDFLKNCTKYNIPVTIHNRNMAKSTWITPSIISNSDDCITKQILFREDEKKRAYIIRRLLKAKFRSMEWLIPSPSKNLQGIRKVSGMRGIESWHAKKYWTRFFKDLSINSTRRSGDHDMNAALNATSKFISGIILRWISYHKLSPNHAYLHEPTDYPSLVYDFIEPYRGYFDKIIYDTYLENKEHLVARSIDGIKHFLDTMVYVEATRQTVTFHELLHGIVLAFRSYLLGNKRFIVPIPGKPRGGRPIKAGYRLYGREAGITNFWPETEKIASNFEKQMNVN